MTLNEQQLTAIISEATRKVLSESVLNNYVKMHGMTVRNTTDGKKYVDVKIPVGEGSLHDNPDLITKYTGISGEYDVLNPYSLNSDRLYPSKKYPEGDRMIGVYDSVIRKIEERGRRTADQMQKEMRGFVKVYPSIINKEKGKNGYITIWEDGWQWGAYVRMILVNTAMKTRYSTHNEYRQARYDWNDIKFCTSHALSAMKAFFNENAETEREFEEICKTRMDSNRWIIQFSLDEDDTVAGMVEAAEYETGKKAMTSPSAPGVYMFKF